jgi:hypothetical protein
MASKTINNTLSSRVENQTALSGSEALTVENVQQPDQTISAGVEEQTALAGFKASQMQSMLLRSDQDVTAEFLGVRHAINATLIAGPVNTIDHIGDLEQEIFTGDIIRVEGTVADDGYYQVATVVEGAGTTVVTLTDGHVLPAGAGGAVGTLARVASYRRMSYGYTMDTVTLATGVVEIGGDVSDVFEAGDVVQIATSNANDGIWSVVSVTTDGPPVTTTTIVLEDLNDGGLLVDNTNDGNLVKTELAFVLAANVPMLWSIDGGILNPFISPDAGVVAPALFNADRGDVAFCMVNNAGTVNAEFQAIISTNAIIF